ALGKGEAEGKPSAASRLVSKGLTRSRTDRLQVVQSVPAGGAAGVAAPEGPAGGTLKVTALHSGAATALKAEPEAKLSPAGQLELRVDTMDAKQHAKAAASEKRAEARAKGYHIFPRSDSREQNANAERKPGVGPATQSRGAG